MGSKGRWSTRGLQRLPPILPRRARHSRDANLVLTWFGAVEFVRSLGMKTTALTTRGHLAAKCEGVHGEGETQASQAHTTATRVRCTQQCVRQAKGDPPGRDCEKGERGRASRVVSGSRRTVTRCVLWELGYAGVEEGMGRIPYHRPGKLFLLFFLISFLFLFSNPKLNLGLNPNFQNCTFGITSNSKLN